MKRRDTERFTDFSRRIFKECEFFDLQGLCKNDRGDYTIAVEAIDMENTSVDEDIIFFDVEQMCAKAYLAQRLGACMTVLLHKQEEGENYIYRREFKLSKKPSTDK